MSKINRSVLMRVGAVVLVLLIANAVLLSDLSLNLRGWAALMILVLLPGILLWELFGADLAEPSTSRLPSILGFIEWLGLSTGLGFGCLIIVSLLYSYLPIGMPLWLSLVVFNGIVLVLALWRLLSQKEQGSQSSHGDNLANRDARLLYIAGLGLVILLGVGGYLRLANNGYSEFQGDEARAMLRAAAVVQGYEDVLFIHRKGPTEILVPAAFYSVLGQMNERVARLPFAVANLAGLLVLWAVGWRIFGGSQSRRDDGGEGLGLGLRLRLREMGPLVGWIGAMLLAVDGYFIGFARIVQYQSVVFLVSVLVVWLLIRTLANPKSASRSLPVAAFLLGAGLLSHYEAGLVALPGLVFLWAWFTKSTVFGEQGPSQRFAGFLPAIAILLGMIAIFYVPFVLNPTFSDTYRYLSESRVGGGDFPYNNLEDFWTRTTLYSTSLYVVLLGALGIIGLVAGGWWRPSAPLRAGMAGGRHNQRHNYTASWAMLTVWWLGPFGLAMFVTADPRTHVYTAFFGWALLVGLGAVALLKIGPVRIGGIVLLMVLFGYFGTYAYWYFVHTGDEILRHWDSDRPSGYPVTYELPTRQGIFGFPMKNGWDAVRGLYLDGELDGSYLTNTKPHVVNWYLRNVDFCTRNHRYFFYVEDNNLYKHAENQELRKRLQDEYTHWGTILVKGNQRLEIYDNQLRRQRGVDQEPLLFPVEHFEAELHDKFSDPYFDITEPYVTAQVSPIADSELDLPLVDPINGNRIHLLGYSVDRRKVAPDQSLLVTLYWQGEQPMSQDYKVFNQIIDMQANVKVGQLDGQPGCDGRPTSQWEPGQVVVDRHRVPIADDANPGEYPLIVGMYDPQTSARLELVDEQGQINGNFVELGTIIVSLEGNVDSGNIDINSDGDRKESGN